MKNTLSAKPSKAPSRQKPRTNRRYNTARKTEKNTKPPLPPIRVSTTMAWSAKFAKKVLASIMKTQKTQAIFVEYSLTLPREIDLDAVARGDYDIIWSNKDVNVAPLKRGIQGTIKALAADIGIKLDFISLLINGDSVILHFERQN